MTLNVNSRLSGEISRLLQLFRPLKSHPFFTIYCSRAFRSNPIKNWQIEVPNLHSFLIYFSCTKLPHWTDSPGYTITLLDTKETSLQFHCNFFILRSSVLLWPLVSKYTLEDFSLRALLELISIKLLRRAGSSMSLSNNHCFRARPKTIQ